MVEPVNIFLTSSLITVQNLVAVSHHVCAHVGGPQNLVDAGARIPQFQGRVSDSYKNAYPAHVTIPNLVAQGQTVWALVGVPKIWGKLGPRPIRLLSE